MGPITDIESQLRRDEGDLAHVYFLNGIPHVGVGHNLLTGPLLSEAVRAQILRDDLAWCRADCASLASWAALSPARQGVLLNMCFNMGWRHLTAFHDFLAALAAGAYDRAADAMLASAWARDPTTARRAARLAQQMRTDQWV